MITEVPTNPKIYHILHVDRLHSVVAEGCLLSDAEISKRQNTGTSIGMKEIKQRRLNELKLNCYPDVYVGQCVPFYFCPRSIMLYMIYKGNHSELGYREGQKQIIHLEADLHEVVKWAEVNEKRWAFTLSNAGARYVEYRNSLNQLQEIDWFAVDSRDWGNSQKAKQAKQAEFLLEENFPWQLIRQIGVHSLEVEKEVNKILLQQEYKPLVTVKSDWYY